jgi:outer membrane protein OmpA-like peptidoglycan-associated protein
MIKGKSYHLSFDIKPENPILESLGILFSDTLILVEKEKLLNLKPSLDIGSQYSGLSKRKQKEWVKIELDYVATGKEKYIVIGNFQPDNQQVKKYIYKPSPDETYHYYIDNIVLNAPDSLCWCKDSAVRKQRIYDQNERHSFDPLYGIEPVSIDRNAIGNPVEVAEKNDTIRLGDLSFEFNSADLDPVTISTIKTYFENPNLKSISSIDIYGHTDAVGKPKYNLELSKKRAQAVKSVLDDLGLTMFIHDVLGYGNKKPIASNETEDGRKLNRRVEIVVHFENQ